MKAFGRLLLLVPAVALLLSACSDGTGPKYPEPTEPPSKGDSIPGTGSTAPRPVLYG
jgi:hypothetical protein